MNIINSLCYLFLKKFLNSITGRASGNPSTRDLFFDPIQLRSRVLIIICRRWWWRGHLPARASCESITTSRNWSSGCRGNSCSWEMRLNLICGKIIYWWMVITRGWRVWGWWHSRSDRGLINKLLFCLTVLLGLHVWLVRLCRKYRRLNIMNWGRCW